MSDRKKGPFPRDRDGVPFQGPLGEDDMPDPVEREDEAEKDAMDDPGVNSQEADEFMRERKFKKP